MMKIGLMMGADGTTRSLDEIVELARLAEAAKFDHVWLANIFSLDAILALAIAGRETKTIKLGSAVTPSYPRHPTAMAQQALSAAAATGNRFTLGIGVSHAIVIEDMLGLSFDKPAKHMREYLNVLMPLLRGEIAQIKGQQYTAINTQIAVPGATTPSVVIAALGPAMLKLAGEMTDGTNTWMVGPKTIENHVAKHINAAAASAGRAAPRIIGGFPIVVTNNVEHTKNQLADTLRVYGTLPSYRAMLDREGLSAPEDLALVGDEAELRAQITRIADSGVTEFMGAIINTEEGAYERTFEFLKSV